ncbi:translation repressor protein [uncultured Caudovirales phage]|uniref:Translation repressor protein n=1 Tax=uncultured Caudovirales phage TaxID=2100421 RepID=A0A6J5M378_9CAUD|nr:translation repressor protein [uncultured Caudovirales phage]
MLSVIDSLIEVTLNTPDDFLKVKETLTRIGVSSKKDKTLYQSCHILHKRDKNTKESKYYIVHFKELFKLDGKPVQFSEDDIARRNTIANVLAEWKLVNLVDKSKSASPVTSINTIQIVPYKEKVDWKLEAKYNIGNSKKKN